jgi:hypothetical protein
MYRIVPQSGAGGAFFGPLPGYPAKGKNPSTLNYSLLFGKESTLKKYPFLKHTIHGGKDASNRIQETAINLLFDEDPKETVPIDSSELITTIQYGGVANLSALEEHIKINIQKANYNVALGLKVLVDIKNDMHLDIKFDRETQANRVVIPSSVNLRSYVDRAIQYFLDVYRISMILQPIVRKKK